MGQRADPEESGDLRDEIARLEARVDKLARTIERCRKIATIAKFAIAAGALVALALVAGAVRFNPVTMIGSMAAVIGAIVVLGSNLSTSRQAAADLRAAEDRRDELIEAIDLRVIDTPPC
jgi:hypothetical protein